MPSKRKLDEPKDDLLNLIKKMKETEDQIIIPVNSFTSKDKYEVSIKKNDFKTFSCTCGNKFKIRKRNKCKHISFVKPIINIVKQNNKYSNLQILENLEI